MNVRLLIVFVLCRSALGTPVTWEFEGGGPPHVGSFTGFMTFDDEAPRISLESAIGVFPDGHSKMQSLSTYEGFGEISLTGSLIGHLEAPKVRVCG